MGFALTPGEAPLHFSRSKNVMHVADSYETRSVIYTTNIEFSVWGACSATRTWPPC